MVSNKPSLPPKASYSVVREPFDSEMISPSVARSKPFSRKTCQAASMMALRRASPRGLGHSILGKFFDLAGHHTQVYCTVQYGFCFVAS
jgi:hypothetical protein